MIVKAKFLTQSFGRLKTNLKYLLMKDNNNLVKKKDNNNNKLTDVKLRDYGRLVRWEDQR